jgi:hypothetical protein
MIIPNLPPTPSSLDHCKPDSHTTPLTQARTNIFIEARVYSAKTLSSHHFVNGRHHNEEIKKRNMEKSAKLRIKFRKTDLKILYCAL